MAVKVQRDAWAVQGRSVVRGSTSAIRSVHSRQIIEDCCKNSCEVVSFGILAATRVGHTAPSSVSMSDRLLDILMGVFELVVFFAVAVAMIVVSREFWIP
jgi:hypothetical protein